jgi:hypothetical protein
MELLGENLSDYLHGMEPGSNSTDGTELIAKLPNQNFCILSQTATSLQVAKYSIFQHKVNLDFEIVLDNKQTSNLTIDFRTCDDIRNEQKEIGCQETKLPPEIAGVTIGLMVILMILGYYVDRQAQAPQAGSQGDDYIELNGV